MLAAKVPKLGESDQCRLVAVIFHKSNVPDMAKVYGTRSKEQLSLKQTKKRLPVFQCITSQFNGEQAITDLALPESLFKDYSQLFDFIDITAPPGSELGY